MARRRLSVQEAAGVLGVSVDAVRSRIRRGTLTSDKGEDGRVFVWLGSDQPTAKPESEDEGSTSRAELAEELREQVGYLREQLRREQDAHAEARRIIAGLVQRVPELEAAPAPPPRTQPRGSDLRAEEAPEGSTPGGGRAATEAGGEGPEGSEARPWWRRVFGG